MKSRTFVFTLLVLATAVCPSFAQTKPKPPAPSQPTGSVRTPEQAVEIIRELIRKNGRDPAREEITAKWIEGEWYVESRHIHSPNNKGSSRFVPGGHTLYLVSPEGKVLKTYPGA